MHRLTRRARWTLVALTLAAIGCGGRTGDVGSQLGSSGDAGLSTESGRDAAVFCTILWTCDAGTVRIAVGQSYDPSCDGHEQCVCYVGDDGGGTVTCYVCAAPR